MSVTSDLRSCADSAVHQGRQAYSAARAEFSGVSERASETLNRAAASVLEGMRGYADRADERVTALKRDARYGKLLGTAESLSTVVTEIFEEHVVKPVRSLTRAV